MRNDLLISVCLASAPETEANIKRLAALSDSLSKTYAYYEIVIISRATTSLGDEILRRIPNVRLLEVGAHHGEYRCRVIAASEAIGDFVLLTDLAEIDHIDGLALLEEAEVTGKIAYSVRSGSTSVSLPVELLGRASSLRVSLQNLRSIAYPRTHLNVILRRDDAELALRFPPLSSEKSISVPCLTVPSGRRGLSGAGARLSLLNALMVNAAPRVLTAVSLLSCATFTASIAGLIYTIAALFTVTNLEPGWFSTMLTLNAVSVFFSFSVFGLCIGLKKVLELLKPAGGSDLISEKGSIDLFSSAFQDLNVEVASEADYPIANPSIPSSSANA